MDKHCLDCSYCKGNTEADLCCCYIFITGKRRPCPPGKGCTEKIKRKTRRKTSTERKREERAAKNG